VSSFAQIPPSLPYSFSLLTCLPLITMTPFKPMFTAFLLSSAVYLTTAAPTADSPPTLKPGKMARECGFYQGKLGYGTSNLTLVSPNLFTDGLNDGGRVQYDDKSNKVIISTGQDSLEETLFTLSFNVPGAGPAVAVVNPPYVIRLIQNDYCEMVLPQKPITGSILTVSKTPMPQDDDPGSSDKSCQEWIGIQDPTALKTLNVVGNLFPNAYTDGKTDGTRVVYDKDNLNIIVVTGKDSLPESLVTINIKAPGSNNKDDGPYVYRLLQNSYCSRRIKKPVDGSVITVQTGPVPRIPRVNGGNCTTYMGPDDAAAVELPGSKDLIFEDASLKNDGTVVKYDKESKTVRIITGKKARDTGMVQFVLTTTWPAVSGAGGGTSSQTTGFRIRSQDSCFFNLFDWGSGTSESYTVLVGTPALY
jgi:hypothetical protein